jgi:hypothetical protein
MCLRIASLCSRNATPCCYACAPTVWWYLKPYGSRKDQRVSLAGDSLSGTRENSALFLADGLQPSGSSTATFNTVNVYQFEPIITTIRQATTESQSENGQKEQYLDELAKFDYLSTLNFKFMNFGSQSIRSGDIVVNITYQPDRCLKTFTLFHKRCSANTPRGI